MSYLTNQYYLNQDGLKALIIKIASIYEECRTDLNNHEDRTAALEALMEKLYAGSETLASFDDAKTLTANICEFIQALRDELGDSADAVAGKDVYARLAELEAQAADYETRIADLEDKAFESVSMKYVAADKAIKLAFGSKNVAIDEATMTGVAQAEIDVTDFVIDGMIDDVMLVTAVTGVGLVKDSASHAVDDQDNKLTFDSYEQWQPEFANSDAFIQFCAEHNGCKFLAMVFNSTPEADAVPATKKCVLVDLNNLFNDYEFKAQAVDSDYVQLEVGRVDGASNTVNEVTYTVSLGETATEDFELVEGRKTYTVDLGGGATAEKTYRGIKDLHLDLEAAEADIDELQEQVQAANTGLLDRTAAIEETLYGESNGVAGGVNTEDGVVSRLEAVEAWINEDGIIAINDIKNTFDVYKKLAEYRAAGDNSKTLEDVWFELTGSAAGKPEWL